MCAVLLSAGIDTMVTGVGFLRFYGFYQPGCRMRSWFGVRLMGWMGGPSANQREKAKHSGNSSENSFIFNYLWPPYFSRAVRRFGENRAKRDQNRPARHSGSQELFARKPANTGDFRRSAFG